jgi:hypothetical protein
MSPIGTVYKGQFKLLRTNSLYQTTPKFEQATPLSIDILHLDQHEVGLSSCRSPPQQRLIPGSKNTIF